MRTVLVAMLFTVILAGCFDDEGGAPDSDATDIEGDDPRAGETGTPYVGIGANATEHLPVRITRYLTTAGTLVPEPPDEGRVDVSIPPEDVYVASGWDSVAFAEAAGSNGTWIVDEDAELTLWFGVTEPVMTDGYADVVVHLGTSRTVPLVVSASTQPLEETMHIARAPRFHLTVTPTGPGGQLTAVVYAEGVPAKTAFPMHVETGGGESVLVVDAFQRSRDAVFLPPEAK